ncbi:MAG: PrsW family intramembrane metalloprotease [Nannocystaceae bacterium]|nr:PrsW family intramembrane metalloprotease [Nannocystaceae bacterium]
MPGKWQLAALGAVPALLAMAYFDWLDAKRPEPRRTLRIVALAGGFMAVPVLGFGYLLEAVVGNAAPGEGTYAAAAYTSLVVAAIPEEACKLAVVLLLVWRRPEFDERMDGIVYGARAGLGFALVENVIYLLLMPHNLQEYFALFVGRAVLAVPGHATWGGIMGYYAARRRFDGRGPGLLGGYLFAVALHGIYDMFLFGAPVAIAAGHTWLALGVAGIPVAAYIMPAIVVSIGAVGLRHLARRAVADDDWAEQQAARRS